MDKECRNKRWNEEKIEMVGTSTIVAACVTLFVSLLLPIIIYIVYGVKNKGKGVWTAWLLGAAGFFVTQIVIRVPILQLLSLNNAYLTFVQNHYVLYCFALAFTAGLFELAGRYAVAKILSKKLSYERGIAAGLGHGGIEAMMLVGFTYINNLIYIVMINSGTFDALVEQTAGLGVDVAPLMQVKDALLNTSAGMFYMAGLERILTMLLHIALSLMVCYFVWKKKDLQGILTCLVIHWAADFGATVMSGLATPYLGKVISQTTSYVLIYAYLIVIAIVSVVYILHVRKSWKTETAVMQPENKQDIE